MKMNLLKIKFAAKLKANEMQCLKAKVETCINLTNYYC